MFVDLSYPVHEGMFKYPSDPSLSVTVKEAEIIEEENPILDESGYQGGNEVRKKYKSGFLYLHLRNHHGTHIDAPSHKIPNSKTIEDFCIQKFINGCMFVDLTTTDLLQRNKREITEKDISDLLPYDTHVESIIFYTGFCDEMKKYEGKLYGDEKTAFEKTFPYFGMEAADLVAGKMPFLNVVGIDSFSFDPQGSNSEVHRILFSKEILPLETLVNLRSVRSFSEKSFRLACVPLILKGGDAAPVRAFALEDGRF